MGQFGPSGKNARTWTRSGSGTSKLEFGSGQDFEVRKIHNDITFIDTFLTPEFCKEYNLFSFNYNEQGHNYVIESREFQKVKQRLLRTHELRQAVDLRHRRQLRATAANCCCDTSTMG